MPPLRTIVAIVDAELEYARGVLYGLYEYVNSLPGWYAEHLSPRELTPERQLSRGVAGLVVQSLDERTAQWVRAQSVPIVNVGDPVGDGLAPCVLPNHQEVGQAAAEHFLERGFRRLGFFGPTGKKSYAQERLSGFARAAEAAGLTVDVFPDGEIPLHDRKGIHRWLKQMGMPAGVLASDDFIAWHFLRRVQSVGLKVPEDVAIVGVDNTRLLCETAKPRLSSVIIPCERIGYEAAALLAKMIGGAAAPRGPLMLKPLGVFVRESSDTFASEDPVVARAIRLMQQKTNLSATVGDLLRELKVSRRKLEYRFQASLGRSPGQIMRLMQMTRAKQMLRTSPLPLTTIAVHCGFASARHFARSFRQQTGLTPSRYREQSYSPIVAG